MKWRLLGQNGQGTTLGKSFFPGFSKARWGRLQHLGPIETVLIHRLHGFDLDGMSPIPNVATTALLLPPQTHRDLGPNLFFSLDRRWWKPLLRRRNSIFALFFCFFRFLMHMSTPRPLPDCPPEFYPKLHEKMLRAFWAAFNKNLRNNCNISDNFSKLEC